MTKRTFAFEELVNHDMIPHGGPCELQQQQGWLRIILAFVFYAYIAIHGQFFADFGRVTGAIVAGYIGINLLAIFWHIPQYPRSPLRLLAMPLVDCMLISLAMFNDGGHASPAFFLFLSVIFGNGLRYGQQMLIYTQILSVISLLVLAILTPLILNLPDDWTVLGLEILGLLYISTYAKIIIRRTLMAIEEKRFADRASSRLLIDVPTPAFTYEESADGARIVHANPAMAKITGIPIDELPGQPCKRLCIHEDGEELDRACLDSLYNTILELPTLSRTYVRAPSKGRHSLQLMCETTVTHIGGKTLGVCFISDITESERYYHELQEAQMQGYVAALSSGLAHDFRNVLASIMGEAEMMRLACSDEKMRDGLELIVRASERGSDMTTQLLQLGKGASREQQKIGLADGLEATVKLARVRLPANVQLDCRIADKLPEIMGDTAQIEQVLLNLVNNAAQAIRDAGRIVVEAFPDPKHMFARRGRPALCIRVSDNGIGIPEENLPRIFDAFWTSRKECGGTGLGLSMVRRIVRWHHGDIEVSSTPGKGTRFSLYFPPADSESEAKAAAPAPSPEPVMPAVVKHTPWHIVLVEDAPEVLRVHEALLTRMGHKVSTAIHGKQALDLLHSIEWQADFILSDFKMPEMDGLELAQKIRDLGKSIPITILTAYGEDEALLKAGSLNTELLFKPVKFNVLANHIANMQREASPA
ncbi:MAG TPA: ATP-binding protein [Mariprofundaceae bacterium]|nr:ATP-binding protein [Mariprofundaceae bacterium]